MKGKKKLIAGLLFMMVALVFVRCTEDDPTDSTDGTDLDINVQLEATQNGTEGGDDVIFTVSLVDSDGAAITNSTGANLTASVAITGTADEDDFDSDLFNTISIANGQSGGTITLEVTDDSEVEGEETVTLTLSALSVGDIEIASATATITDNDEEGGSTAADISVLASKFYNTDAVTFSFDDEWVTITSKDLPDHKSMYYDEDEDLYEDYDEPNNSDFKKNPGSIQEQNLVFKVPRYPSEATNKESTPMGPMGVTINSVALFNQNAAGDDDIFEELNTFDQYEGHPAGETYHYHTEPVWLTQFREGFDNEALVGILLDGFPVYGTHEDGEEVFSKDDGGILDDYHGHFGVTEDFPDGIYHYHITVDYPWINEDGFYGTAGTLTD